MEYIVGIVVALLTFTIGRFGFDRDRAFYPTVAIVVASYYVLFESTLGGDAGDIALEAAIATAFGALALLAFKRNPWWAVVAIGGHGLFDIAHPYVGAPHAPAAWPGFCLAYDGLAALFLAGLLRSRSGPAHDAEYSSAG